MAEDSDNVALRRLRRTLRGLFIPAVSLSAIVEAALANKADEVITQLYDWERDRIFTVCKSAAAFALSIVGTLLTAMFSTSSNLNEYLVTGSIITAALLLALSAHILLRLRRHAEELAFVLAWYATINAWPPAPPANPGGGAA